MEAQNLLSGSNSGQNNCFYNIQPASTSSTTPPLHHFGDAIKATPEQHMSVTWSLPSEHSSTSISYKHHPQSYLSPPPTMFPTSTSLPSCRFQGMESMAFSTGQEQNVLTHALQPQNTPSSPSPYTLSVFPNTIVPARTIVIPPLSPPITTTSPRMEGDPQLGLSHEIHPPRDYPVQKEKNKETKQDENAQQISNSGEYPYDSIQASHLQGVNLQPASMPSSLHSTLDLSDLELTSMDSYFPNEKPKNVGSSSAACDNSEALNKMKVMDDATPLSLNKSAESLLNDHCDSMQNPPDIHHESKVSPASVTCSESVNQHTASSSNLSFEDRIRTSEPSRFQQVMEKSPESSLQKKDAPMPETDDKQSTSGTAIANSDMSLVHSASLCVPESTKAKSPVDSGTHVTTSFQSRASAQPMVTNQQYSASHLTQIPQQDLLASAMASTFGVPASHGNSSRNLDFQHVSYQQQQMTTHQLQQQSEIMQVPPQQLMQMKQERPLRQAQMRDFSGQQLGTHHSSIQQHPLMENQQQEQLPMSGAKHYQNSRLVEQQQHTRFSQSISPSCQDGTVLPGQVESGSNYIGHAQPIEHIEISTDPPLHSSFIASAYAASHATSYNQEDDSDDGYDYDGMDYYLDNQEPDEPIVINIDLSQRPQSLQQAINMYIDFLIWENNKKLCIAYDDLPTMPCEFEHERYYTDTLKKPTPFPTQKLKNWLKLYNVDIEITDPEGNVIPQTTFPPDESAESLSPQASDSGKSLPMNDMDAMNNADVNSNYMMHWETGRNENGYPITTSVSQMVSGDIIQSTTNATSNGRPSYLPSSPNPIHFQGSYYDEIPAIYGEASGMKIPPSSCSSPDFGNEAVATLAATSAAGLSPRSGKNGPEITPAQVRAMIIQQQMNQGSVTLPVHGSSSMMVRGTTNADRPARRGRPPGRAGRGRSLSCRASRGFGRGLGRQASRRARGRPPSRSYSGNSGFRGWTANPSYCCVDPSCVASPPPVGMMAQQQYNAVNSGYSQPHMAMAPGGGMLHYPPPNICVGQGSKTTNPACGCNFHPGDEKYVTPVLHNKPDERPKPLMTSLLDLSPLPSTHQVLSQKDAYPTLRRGTGKRGRPRKIRDFIGTKIRNSGSSDKLADDNHIWQPIAVDAGSTNFVSSDTCVTGYKNIPSDSMKDIVSEKKQQSSPNTTEMARNSSSTLDMSVTVAEAKTGEKSIIESCDTKTTMSDTTAGVKRGRPPKSLASDDSQNTTSVTVPELKRGRPLETMESEGNKIKDSDMSVTRPGAKKGRPSKCMELDGSKQNTSDTEIIGVPPKINESQTNKDSTPTICSSITVSGNKRGRPPKSLASDISKNLTLVTVPELKRGRPFKIMESEGNKIKDSDISATRPGAKKGRPSKCMEFDSSKQNTSDTEIIGVPPKIDESQTNKDSTPNICSSVRVSGNKRGRPPKIRDSDSTKILNSGTCTSVSCPPSRAKRGRPPKILMSNNARGAISGTIPGIKRGRPPKTMESSGNKGTRNMPVSVLCDKKCRPTKQIDLDGTKINISDKKNLSPNIAETDRNKDKSCDTISPVTVSEGKHGRITKSIESDDAKVKISEESVVILAAKRGRPPKIRDVDSTVQKKGNNSAVVLGVKRGKPSQVKERECIRDNKADENNNTVDEILVKEQKTYDRWMGQGTFSGEVEAGTSVMEDVTSHNEEHTSNICSKTIGIAYVEHDTSRENVSKEEPTKINDNHSGDKIQDVVFTRCTAEKPDSFQKEHNKQGQHLGKCTEVKKKESSTNLQKEKKSPTATNEKKPQVKVFMENAEIKKLPNTDKKNQGNQNNSKIKGEVESDIRIYNLNPVPVRLTRNYHCCKSNSDISLSVKKTKLHQVRDAQMSCSDTSLVIKDENPSEKVRETRSMKKASKDSDKLTTKKFMKEHDKITTPVAISKLETFKSQDQMATRAALLPKKATRQTGKRTEQQVTASKKKKVPTATLR